MDFIGDLLFRIKKKGLKLKIRSDSCAHCVIFQKRFPEIIWQTSDLDSLY